MDASGTVPRERAADEAQTGRAARRLPPMPPRTRKLVTTLHVISSVGWLGLNLGVLTLALTGMSTGDPDLQHAAYSVLALLGGVLLIPLSLTAFVTGVLLSLFTSWGLLRYRWVIVKLVLTLIAVVLIPSSLLPGLNEAAEIVANTPPGRFAAVDRSGLGAVSAGCVSTTMYLTCTILSVYKPWGRTRLGRRRLAASRSGREPNGDPQ
ncbi:DUF2269 family protein [Streptosporangium sp. KLBMP 9127]|nr:DUF2269 family protein [Streptosporangium sp. KLBMP 9127]